MVYGHNYSKLTSAAKAGQSIAFTGSGGVLGAIVALLIDWACAQYQIEITPEQKAQLIAWGAGIGATVASGARRGLSNYMKWS